MRIGTGSAVCTAGSVFGERSAAHGSSPDGVGSWTGFGRAGFSGERPLPHLRPVGKRCEQSLSDAEGGFLLCPVATAKVFGGKPPPFNIFLQRFGAEFVCQRLKPVPERDRLVAWKGRAEMGRTPAKAFRMFAVERDRISLYPNSAVAMRSMIIATSQARVVGTDQVRICSLVSRIPNIRLATQNMLSLK